MSQSSNIFSEKEKKEKKFLFLSLKYCFLLERNQNLRLQLFQMFSNHNKLFFTIFINILDFFNNEFLLQKENRR